MVKIKIFQLNAVYLDLHKYYVAQKHQYNVSNLNILATKYTKKERSNNRIINGYHNDAP